MSKFFQCCKEHTINFDSVCYAEEQEDSLNVYFTNGNCLILKGKCKELVEQTLAMKAYYSNNIG